MQAISEAAPAHATGGDFAAAWPHVHAELAASGALGFIQALLSGTAPRTAPRCLAAAMALLQVEAGERRLGLSLLADAFALGGHLDAIADYVRELFGQWGHDAYEFDRARAIFSDRLRQVGTPAHLGRFAALLDGNTARKIFIIGLNKTGTTTLQHALQRAGVLCAPQTRHERLFADWAERRFARIVDFCRYFEAFQDIPFSLPYTYQALDQAFPDARFVLGLRDSAEQWYESLVRFHRRILYGGAAPTWELIDQHGYNYPGFVAEISRGFFRWQDFGLYDRDRAIDLYRRHEADVRAYFHGRDDRLLVLNVAEPGAQARFAAFLGLGSDGADFERVNAS
jgi:hypothetical protein